MTATRSRLPVACAVACVVTVGAALMRPEGRGAEPPRPATTWEYAELSYSRGGTANGKSFATAAWRAGQRRLSATSDKAPDEALSRLNKQLGGEEGKDVDVISLLDRVGQ